MEPSLASSTKIAQSSGGTSKKGGVSVNVMDTARETKKAKAGCVAYFLALYPGSDFVALSSPEIGVSYAPCANVALRNSYTYNDVKGSDVIKHSSPAVYHKGMMS